MTTPIPASFPTGAIGRGVAGVRDRNGVDEQPQLDCAHCGQPLAAGDVDAVTPAGIESHSG